MKRNLNPLARFALILMLAALSSTAFAQATRTWVSGVGDDANPCSRTAPCKTFPGAISKTAAGGEINITDPGGFGAVTITKSITIDGEGFLAGILVASTNGIIVNSATAHVILRNLDINGLGQTGSPGISGVYILNAASVTLENVRIYGFDVACVNFAPQNGNSTLDIHDSVFKDCGNAVNVDASGVLVAPAAGFTAKASLDNVSIVDSQRGVTVGDGGTANVSDSTFANILNLGVSAKSNVGTAIATVSDSSFSGIGSVATHGAIKSNGSGARIYINGNDVTNNYVGLSATGAGQIISSGGNTVNNNTINGAPTSTVPSI